MLYALQRRALHFFIVIYYILIAGLLIVISIFPFACSLLCSCVVSCFFLNSFSFIYRRGPFWSYFLFTVIGRCLYVCQIENVKESPDTQFALDNEIMKGLYMYGGASPSNEVCRVFLPSLFLHAFNHFGSRGWYFCCISPLLECDESSCQRARAYSNFLPVIYMLHPLSRSEEK